MFQMIATLSVYTIIFWTLGAAGCLVAKIFGADDIVQDIENAHRCCHIRERRER